MTAIPLTTLASEPNPSVAERELYEIRDHLLLARRLTERALTEMEADFRNGTYFPQKYLETIRQISDLFPDYLTVRYKRQNNGDRSC